MAEQTKTIVPAEKVNKDTVEALPIHATQGAMKLTPENMAQAMEVAKMMSVSGVAVPTGLRNNAGACLSVAMKAWNWGMEPYSVASKCYVVKNKHGDETLAYEAQLIHAVVNSRAPLKKRLKVTYSGEGPARQCHVAGELTDDDEIKTYDSPAITNITVQNSPLWKADPDQQLHYYSTRAWARRHTPEVILGVYTPEEIDERSNHRAPEDAKDITPRPEEGDYEDAKVDEGPPADFEMISQFGEEIGTFTPTDFAAKLVEEAERLQQIDVDQITLQQFLDNNHATLNQLPVDLRKETGKTLLKMYEDMTPEPEPEPETKPETSEEESGEKAGAPATPEEIEPEPEKTKAEFIEWETTNGKWKFRNLAELKTYIQKSVKSQSHPVENYKVALENNADLLSGLREDENNAEDVIEIETLLQEKITELETSVQKAGETK